MESLFDQLKSETPINKYINEPPPARSSCSPPARTATPPPHSPTPPVQLGSPPLDTPSPPLHLSSPMCKPPQTASSPLTTAEVTFTQRFESLEPKSASSPRRESMPPPSSTIVTKSNNKSRSLSPSNNKLTKPFKVLVERKKFVQNTTEQQRAAKSKGQISKCLKNGEKTSQKFTPTKAQQKLFDPAVLEKAQQLKQLKVKCCKVRVQRQNLKTLQQQLLLKKKTEKEAKTHKKKQVSSPNSSGATAGRKRKINSSSSSLDSSASPTKQARMAKQEKHNSSFFIKLNTGRVSSPVIKKQKANKTKTKSVKLPPVKKLKSVVTTKPTKFTRTQLIKTYGKRFFRAHVKIERCRHPMMLIFESNARARRLQTKRNKSKNLSVSFREQVEIFGDSSDSEASLSDLDGDASTSKGVKSKTTPMLAMPARLKKVENGKVVDDIELDPTLFVVPQSIAASTPYTPGARKKREKKSYSPLKDDGTPSPRKEQLKLANEKMPPSGLRRLAVDDADEDTDEDDECEYIVPIEIPARRTSRASSTNVAEENAQDQTNETIAEDKSVQAKKDDEEADIQNVTKSTKDSSDESFASAQDLPSAVLNDSNEKKSEVVQEAATKEYSGKKCEIAAPSTEQSNVESLQIATSQSKLPRFGSLSPAQSLNSLNDLVDSLINNDSQDKSNEPGADKATTTATAATAAKHDNEIVKEQNVPELLSDDVSKLEDTLDDGISLHLFVEDESVIEDRQIVDGIINERIDELSKNKTVRTTTTPPDKTAAE